MIHATPRRVTRGGAATYDTYRLITTNARGYTAFGEIEIAETIGGANAISTPLVLGSTFNDSSTAPYAATNCFDGDLTTHPWYSNNTSQQHYVGCELASAISPVEVRVFGCWREDNEWTTPYWTAEYKLQATNGGLSAGGWVDLVSVSNVGGYNGNKYGLMRHRLYPGGDPSIPFMFMLEVADNNGDITYTGISEFDVGDASGYKLQGNIGNRDGWMSGYFSTDSIGNAFDNDTGTRALALKTDYISNWVFIADLGPASAFTPTKFKVTSTATSARAPKDFNLRVSANGYDWTTVKAVTGETGWSSAETREFTI